MEVRELRLLLFGALVFSVLCTPLAAQQETAQPTMPDLTKPITMDQALAIAFCQSPDIKAAVALTQRSQAVIAETRANFMPRFNADVLQQWQGPAVTIPAGAFGPAQTTPVSLVNANSTQISTNVLLPLDINNRLAFATEVAKYQYQIDYLNLRGISEQLLFDVQSAYYNLLRAMGQEEVSQAAVDVANARLKDATARFAAGTAPRFDVTRAQVDVANLTQQLIQSKARVATARSALNRVMGIDVNSPTEIVRSEVVVQNLKVDIAKEVQKAQSLRPNVLAAETSIALNRANARLQRTGILPSLSASGTVNYAFEPSGFTSQNTTWTALLDLKIPIWDGGVTKARVAQAYADVNRSQAQVEQSKLGVGLEARTAALNLQEAIERVSTTAENVALAEEALRLATVRYTAGISTLVEVTDAESALTQAQFNAVNARYDYAIALADLQRATSQQPDIVKLQLLCPPGQS